MIVGIYHAEVLNVDEARNSLRLQINWDLSPDFNPDGNIYVHRAVYFFRDIPRFFGKVTKMVEELIEKMARDIKTLPADMLPDAQQKLRKTKEALDFLKRYKKYYCRPEVVNGVLARYHAAQRGQAPPALHQLKVPFSAPGALAVHYFTGSSVTCPLSLASPFERGFKYCSTIFALTGLSINYESLRPEGAGRDSVFHSKHYFKRFCKAPGNE